MYRVRSKNPINGQIREFIQDYTNNKSHYQSLIKDRYIFDYIIKNISNSLIVNSSGRDRELAMLNIYKSLYEYFGLKNKKQFFKLGFSHLEKYSDKSVG